MLMNGFPDALWRLDSEKTGIDTAISFVPAAIPKASATWTPTLARG